MQMAQLHVCADLFVNVEMCQYGSLEVEYHNAGCRGNTLQSLPFGTRTSVSMCYVCVCVIDLMYSSISHWKIEDVLFLIVWR